MFRLFTTTFALLSLLALATPSNDVPEIEPFDEDEFEDAFGKLVGVPPAKDEDEEDAAA